MIRALLASPKAKGLFQRAILQSDPMVRLAVPLLSLFGALR